MDAPQPIRHKISTRFAADDHRVEPKSSFSRRGQLSVTWR